MAQEEVKEFYDQYVDHQSKIGVSTRHRIIHQNLRNIGLKSDSNVLEIGCGIGTVSSLIIKSTPQGKFLGVDISPESIATAKKLNPQSNADFIVNDMSDFTSDIQFDFIVFPDVLEHIPVEQHSRLFENVAKVCKPSTKVLINIPEPNALHWVRKNRPQDLQIIDQSLSMQDLLNNTYPHGFQVQSICPYSIHMNHPNYLRIVLIRDGEITDFHKVGKVEKTLQNLKARFL
ncbi:MAG: class I SAM-dependent methyltransferase [Bacteroidetes bacterium]|nr:MAG: class I SAM-dependent methyltransferase [Bacteroidota bacterium]TNF00587.1 MAG: class I SAM-dependent methyltransferase [Bacteroidota bacterium]